MERVWAVTACLGMAGLFWSGYGKKRWRRYGISPTRVAALCLICGASQWVPPLLATLTPWLAEFVGITLGVGAILGALGIIAGRSWAAKAPWGIATSGALGLGIWTLLWQECAIGAGPLGRLVWTPGMVQWALVPVGGIVLGCLGIMAAMVRLAHPPVSALAAMPQHPSKDGST